MADSDVARSLLILHGLGFPVFGSFIALFMLRRRETLWTVSPNPATEGVPR